jgi:redox-sensitive bicupin YhaK (pirin superfamily)
LPDTKGRKTWVQVTRGAITVDGQDLGAGDGMGISDEAALTAKAAQDAEIIVFDMAA